MIRNVGDALAHLSPHPNAMNTDLENQLACQRASYVEMVAQNISMKAVLSTSKIHCGGLEERFHEISRRITNLENKFRQIAEKLTSQLSVISFASKSLKKREDLMNCLTRKMDNLDVLRKAHEKNVANFCAQLATKEKENSLSNETDECNAKDVLKGKQNSYAELSSMISAKESEHEALIEQCKREELEKASMLEKLKKEVLELDNSLKTSLGKLTEALQSLRQQKESNAERVFQLETAEKEMANDVKELQIEICTLGTTYEELVAQVQSTCDSIPKAMDKLRCLEREMEDHREKVTILRDREQNLLRKVNELKRQKLNLQSECDEAQAKLVLLTEAKRAAGENKLTAQKEVKDLQAYLYDLQAKRDASKSLLEHHMKMERKQEEEHRNMLNDLKIQLSEARRENDKFRRILEEIKLQKEQRLTELQNMKLEMIMAAKKEEELKLMQEVKEVTSETKSPPTTGQDKKPQHTDVLHKVQSLNLQDKELNENFAAVGPRNISETEFHISLDDSVDFSSLETESQASSVTSESQSQQAIDVRTFLVN
ncbi:unnamed protein product [Soboliphyme baturini]|uniref:Coiled-coil domain-containing protein 150 n=1 Tax=Soboliphyme baturini TaxID=241478 RepID=A0A183IGP1_9BILA|nr:unnamed protein product [Soboliphyme baturini]